jgi:hypothetical protein
MKQILALVVGAAAATFCAIGLGPSRKGSIRKRISPRKLEARRAIFDRDGWNGVHVPNHQPSEKVHI